MTLRVCYELERRPRTCVTVKRFPRRLRRQFVLLWSDELEASSSISRSCQLMATATPSHDTITSRHNTSTHARRHTDAHCCHGYRYKASCTRPG